MEDRWIVVGSKVDSQKSAGDVLLIVFFLLLFVNFPSVTYNASRRSGYTNLPHLTNNSKFLFLKILYIKLILKVNTVGTFNMCRIAARYMYKNEPNEDNFRGNTVTARI